MKLLLCAGARPNFPKISAIERAARSDSSIEVSILRTGQHYSHDLDAVFFRDLELPAPSFDLNIESRSPAKQTAEIISGTAKAIASLRPDWVVVVGDVTSTLACAIAARQSGARLAHVEAGLRSFDERMIEEWNRRAVDHMSDLLFASEPSALGNLFAEGLELKSNLVGNVMVDSLLRFLPVARSGGGVIRDEFAILTVHRAENTSDREKLVQLVFAASRFPGRVIFPVHPRSKDLLIGIPFPENIVLTGPFPYLEFLRLLDQASLVITDSGGLQEEASALGVPCFTIRDSTERPLTLLGSNRLVGSSPAALEAEIEKCDWDSLRTGPKELHDTWDGRASERILEILLSAIATPFGGKK